MKRLLIALALLPAGLKAAGTMSAADKAIIDRAKQAQQVQPKPQPQQQPPKK